MFPFSLQSVLTGAVLPPLGLVLLLLPAAFLAWRGRRWGAGVVALAACLILLLSTPLSASLLMRGLEADIVPGLGLGRRELPLPPEAIIVLGAEVVHGAAGPQVGPLTLERLRAGAALHRRTGLPLLVTGGPLAKGDPSIGALMAASLRADFGVPVRWIEGRAGDTRDNAVLSVAMLRESGIGAAHLVTHGWHLQRALEAFARLGFPVAAGPVSLAAPQRLGPSDLMPRPDHLAESWFAIREWVGRLVYALRD